MLAPKKKLTKKELKHDPLLDTLEKGKEIYEEYSKQIVSAIVAVIIIMLLGWGWMNNRETTNNAAMLAGTRATLAAMSGMNDNVTSELEQVVSEYAGNPNILQASYQLGLAKIKAGDLSGARDIYSDMAHSSDSQMKTAGQLKLAYIDEKEANYTNAAELYAQVGMTADGLIADYAKLQAGYAYFEAGNIAQANEMVTDLLADEPIGKFKEYVKYLEGKVLEK